MSNLIYFVGVLQIVVAVYSAPTEDDLLITLPNQGQIQGVQFINGNNKVYYGFHGIPFATPPLGDLRFEAPQPPQPWSGILDGSKESKNCIAGNMVGNMLSVSIPETSEDCLYINVYTPALKPAEKLPVMFWIYGGAFVGGGALLSMNNPDFLMEEDVILVTFNYRVGAFGFLSTGDEAMRGNAGLKDQVLALQWTHDNIAYFGGDPDKVTIFGQSAGGQSTGLQMMSKLSKGLFRAAIVQSGSVLTNSSATTDPRSYALQVANYFTDGDYGNDTLKLKQFLQQKTTEEISNAVASITGLDIHAWPSLEVEGEGAFITESPFVLSETGNFNQVPVLIGICAEEATMFIRDEATAQEMALILDNDRKKAIPSDLIVNPEDEEAAITKIRDLYLRGNETFYSNLVSLVEFTSDNKFGRALIKHAELQSKYVPVYLYQFSYYGRSNYVPFVDGLGKVGHGAELAFIFNQTGSGPFLSDEDDLLTQNRIVKLWTNFAKYLNPTPEESELFSNILWPTTNPSTLQYLDINNTLEIKEGLKQPRYQGWNETYYSYGKQPFITF